MCINVGFSPDTVDFYIDCLFNIIIKRSEKQPYKQNILFIWLII